MRVIFQNPRPAPYPISLRQILFFLITVISLIHWGGTESSGSENLELRRVIQSLNSDNFDTRQKASQRLRTMTEELKSNPELIAEAVRAMDYPNHGTSVAGNIYLAIESVGEPAFAPIVSVLMEPNRKMAKPSAVSLLIEIDPEKALDPAIYFIGIADQEQLIMPVESYAKLGKPAEIPLKELLAKGDIREDTRNVIIRILGLLGGSSSTQILITNLKNPNASTRQDAALALGNRKSSEAVGKLIDTLRDGNSEVRRWTAESLGKIGDPTAILPLAGLLEDEGVGVAHQAMKSLETIGNLPADPFIKMLLGSSNSSSRTRAASMLAFIKDINSAPSLIRALEDDQSNVRAASIQALIQIGSPCAPLLIKSLESDNLWVREGAVNALRAIGDSEGIESLPPLLRDHSWYIRMLVADALYERGGPSALDEIKKALAIEKDELVHQILKEASRKISAR